MASVTAVRSDSSVVPGGGMSSIFYLSQCPRRHRRTDRESTEMGLHVIAGCTVGNRYLLTGQLSEHSGDDVFAARDNETGAEVVVKFQPPKDLDSTAWFTTKGRLL